MKWEQEVSALAREEIGWVFKGRWPRTAAEYIRLARRFGVFVVFVRDMPLRRVRITDDGVMYVPEPGKNYPLSHRVYRHELSEAVLLWEGCAPYVIPVPPCMRKARHTVALKVEKL